MNEGSENPVYAQVARVALLLVGIVASAVLFYFALPLGEQAYLAWLCFVPLLAAIRDRGFLVGCLCALGCLGLTAYLVICGPTYAQHDPHGDPYMVIAGFGQFGVSLGVTAAIWADPTLNKKPAWWFAALATLLEASLLLTLPAHVALTQYRQPVALMLASVGGIWLVSFLIYWTNFQLALMPWKKAAVGAVALAGLSLALAKTGPHATGPTSRFAALQIADPDSESLTKMQTEASAQSPTLVVWPELSGAAMAHGTDTARLCDLSTHSVPFVTSYEDGNKPKPHNVSAVFEGGHESAIYAKRKMFGSEGSIHTPGNDPVAVGSIALAICFDSCYPEAIRASVLLPNVNVISLPAVDPYASNNFLSAMHASYSPFRCAEEGVALVRADGHACSQIVDPYGSIVAELPSGDGILQGSVSTATHWTLYKQLGDWVLVALPVLLLLPKLRDVRKPRAQVG